MVTPSDELIQIIARKNSLQASYINRILKQNEKAINKELLLLIVEFWGERGLDTENLADAYLDLVSATMEEQLYFRKTHNYRNREYQALCDNNYRNDMYMEQYLAALAISDCLWENHVQILKWYKNKIKAAQSCTSYVEVGCGSGINLLPILTYIPGVHITAIDLSKKAIEICEDFLRYGEKKGLFSDIQYEAICKDVYEYTLAESPDIFTMFEVLEHIPDPECLLNRIYEMTNSNTVFYFSTVINSPMPDHIYLFRNKEAIFELMSKSGFLIKDFFCAPANGMSLSQAEMHEAPITIVMELKKGCKENVIE